MSNHMRVLLIGCGYMGKEYCKVLSAQGYEPVVIGRSEESAARFREEMGITVLTGGADKAVHLISDLPEYAIVAVNAQQLCAATLCLLNKGVTKILVEKPAGMNRHEISRIKLLCEQKKAEIFVAYNRRFYASVQKALEIIRDDGGLSSLIFEFTEWDSVIEKIKSDEVKRNVLLANSTHVIDLAFFLMGKPKTISSYIGGGTDWHPNGSRYAGAGISENDILFSYHADWEAPGRWSIEAMTPKHRIYLKPMEQIFLQEKNSLAVEEVKIQDEADRRFKPGLYEQTKAFLTNRTDRRLISIAEHDAALKYYEMIAGLSGESIHAI